MHLTLLLLGLLSPILATALPTILANPIGTVYADQNFQGLATQLFDTHGTCATFESGGVKNPTLIHSLSISAPIKCTLFTQPECIPGATAPVVAVNGPTKVKNFLPSQDRVSPPGWLFMSYKCGAVATEMDGESEVEGKEGV
ncbi:hypothetical protein BU26DRAFT_561969 [Trematosphaeria pertusa]|uniref:Uncharacterized protein n=1 Tax=Trematosphaeria pertusa TaxID=390896 RepID=A0A6A6INV8_9PLEO|nr:uncharacterized protein BU26DRAFT_561969 [Trematosphaeria pertusa]KAF2252215.1 hypothetical protein BU26DRAFT_561969 [Trematosphaeria pertusa]